MKHFINLTIAVLILLNQAFYSLPLQSISNTVQITSTANPGETISATLTPVATETSSFGAYPPPVESTPTTTPTETPVIPTSTPSPTTIPVTPTVTPTLEPSPSQTPTGEVPVDTPQLLLKATGSTYEPGKPVDLEWKINLPKSQSIQSNWQLRVYLPASWIAAEKQSGTFDSDQQVWKIDSPSSSGKLSLIAPDDTSYVDINAAIYDGETELFRGSLVQRGKKSLKIYKSGGEIDTVTGKAKINVKFDKDVLPEDANISIQAPEMLPGSLPYNGKHVLELVAEDMKGNRFHKFNRQAVIEFAFDPDELGIHPSSLALYWYDESTGAWQILPGYVDRQRNVLVAYTDHFSLFALGQNDWESRKVPALDVAQVASFTGAASYSIPVEVPAGPGGIMPSVSLEYNSMSMEGFYFQTSTNAPGIQSDVVVGAQPSWTGAGWSLNASGSILRNMGKDIDWEGDDTYSLTVGNVAMKLVPVSEGSGYIDYKGTDENFWKIRRMINRNIGPHLPYGTYGQENDTWVVWDKTGTRYTFSQRAYYLELLWDDAIYHPGSTSYYNCAQGNRECIKRPWGWFVKEIKYPSGQSLTFNYSLDQDSKCFWYIPNTSTCDGGTTVDQAAYPSEILYPDGKTKIVFSTVSRPDYIWYWGDSLTKNRYEKKRLSTIQVQVNGQIAREYKLNYFTTAENPLVPGSRWTPADPLTNGGAKNYEALSALKSVSQYGLGGVNSGNKLPDITFSYSNQLLLTDINNGQGGIATFVYEPIDANANTGEGSPFTAAGGDPEQSKTLYQGNLSVGLSEVSYLNPTPNLWGTPNGLPVRPGQGYRITCNVRDATGQIQFGMYYSNESAGSKNYSKLVNVSSSGGTYSANVVIPANANRATPAIKYTSGEAGSRITASSCSGVPVLTHYRVTQRTLRDTTTNASYPYTYSYLGAAVNDTAHSTYAGLAANQRSGASTPYTEFRGHSKVTIVDPNGLRTETFFYQDDVNKGRVHDIKQYNNSSNLLLTWSITHWIDSPIVISDSQDANICARSAKGAACLLDQKSVWSYSDWDENRQYGQGVADENSSAYVGLHKIYQYAPTAQYGNLIGVIEQTRSGSGWTSYRLTRTAYAANMVDGGTNLNETKYLVELPGSVNVYECTNGSCDETGLNLRKSSCYLYDDPVNGGTGLCSVSFNGTTKVEVLDTPDSGLITGVRTLLHFGDGATADYTNPHYSDEIYRYDSRGNRIRSTRFTGEGSKTTLVSGVAQVTEACYGVGNQPAGCTDDGYYAYPRWEKNAMGQTTSWTIDYVLGVPTVETDSNGAIIYATYDAFGRMKALIQPGDDSNSPTISANYYDSSPSWIEVIPKNGASSRKIYDGLGRLIQSQQGNVTLTNGARDVVVDYEYNALNQVSRQSVPVDIAPYPYDGSAVYRKQTGSAAITNQYDPLGRLSLSTYTDATQISYSYGIESAQMIQKVSANYYQPISEWLSYTQTIETVTRNNQPVQILNREYQNGFGQTVVVRSALPPYVYYRYDVAGNLLDALTWDGATTFSENGQTYVQGIATALIYDLSGRKINLTDADMGSWDYAYDGVNNLVRQKDAKTQVTCLYYDGLNRLKGKNHQGNVACPGDPGSGYAVSYTYDAFNATNSGRGRRTGMSDYSGSTIWEYDLRGRLIHEAKTVLDKADGNKNLGTYHTYWSYNSDGSIRQMVYPNQETVNYAYTPQGSISQMYSVQDATNATKSYVSATGYNAAGQAINRTLGNGMTQTFTYYPWSQQGGRLKNILAQKSGVPTYQNLTFAYDEVGNVRSTTDSVAGETLNFTYDNLNRLDLVTGAYNEDPAYSSLTGNISSRNGITYYYTDSAHKHAVTSTTDGRSFVYDANGNMTTRTVTGGPFTLGYDFANQVTSISGGSTNARYVYDGDGKRVLAVVNGVRTVYIGDYFEAELGAATTYPVLIPPLVNSPWKVFLPIIMSDEAGSSVLGMGAGNFGNTIYYTHPVATGQASITWRTYYAAGTARVAMRAQGNSGSVYDLYYFLTDNLNSTTKTIKQDGTIAELRYSAWGETRYSNGTIPTKQRYTGQSLAEAGLYFYGSRWYDHSLGRFTQADAIIPQPTNPMAWDRYSYVLNNPLKYIDPTGHYACDDSYDDCGRRQDPKFRVTYTSTPVPQTPKLPTVIPTPTFPYNNPYGIYIGPQQYGPTATPQTVLRAGPTRTPTPTSTHTPLPPGEIAKQMGEDVADIFSPFRYDPGSATGTDISSMILSGAQSISLSSPYLSWVYPAAEVVVGIGTAFGAVWDAAPAVEKWWSDADANIRATATMRSITGPTSSPTTSRITSTPVPIPSTTSTPTPPLPRW